MCFFQHFSRTPTAKYKKKKKKKKKIYLPTYPIFLEPLQETNNFFFRPNTAWEQG